MVVRLTTCSITKLASYETVFFMLGDYVTALKIMTPSAIEYENLENCELWHCEVLSNSTPSEAKDLNQGSEQILSSLGCLFGLFWFSSFCWRIDDHGSLGGMNK